MRRSAAGKRIVTVLWVGSLWTVGLMVAPMLFATLEDRTQAGHIAGALFSLESYVGLVCGLCLLIFAWAEGRLRRLGTGLVLTMVLITLVGEFGLQPAMAALKQQGLTDGSAFAGLHQAASALYLCNCVLGLALVVFDRDRTDVIREA